MRSIGIKVYRRSTVVHGCNRGQGNRSSTVLPV